MKHTKDDLAKMSIAEINETLHKMLDRWFEGNGCITWMLNDDIITQTEGGYRGRVNYCNNWNDIIPLAVEHGFNLGDSYEARYKTESNQLGKVWVATFDGCEFKDISPQRAIACCLILALQEREA